MSDTDDRERWQILVNTVASAWNNGLVPGNDEEAFRWAQRLIQTHADKPATRSDELISIARLTKECDELREALARCVKYVPLVIINGRSTGNMQPTAITKAEVDLAFADKALATLDVPEEL